LNSINTVPEKAFHCLPDVVGEPVNLEYLQLEYNFFSCTLPTSYASLTGLQILDIEENDIGGVLL